MAMKFTPRGNLVYQPDGAVLSRFFFEAPFFGGIQGPIGSGTSTAGCLKIWRLACLQEPDYDRVRRSRWIVSRETYKELRETTIKTWLQWFPESEWGPFIRSEPGLHHLKDPATGGMRKHPSGDGTYVDCEVIFVAIPDADVAEQICASYEITGFFKNEGQFTDKPVIDELLSRTGRYPSLSRGPGATWWGGWMDMNAPVEGHWLPYMRGDIPLPPDMDEDEKMAFQKPEDWEFYIQPPGLLETIVDGRPVYEFNPEAENQRWLVEPYLKKIQGKTRAWIDRRVLNKIGLHMDGKAVYPTFSEVDHVIAADDRVYYNPNLKIIVGLDFGRDPAAAFLQEQRGKWILLDELCGDNESAALFAPKVKKHIAQNYPEAECEFWGDPRGADGRDNDESTGFSKFEEHGMEVWPATEDNSTEVRRSTVETVLERRHGFGVNHHCLVVKRGLAGGYHYPKIKGRPGLFGPKPVKNRYSHIVEAMENGLIGGGESYSMVKSPANRNPAPVAVVRKKVRLARAAR